MKNCVIIHGGPLTKTPEEPHNLHTLYWQPWIKSQLEDLGIPTLLPALPHPWQPKYEEWKEVVDTFPVTEDTVLIGHSRGVSFLLRWLGDTKLEVEKLIMVAPNLQSESDDKILQDFYAFEIDTAIKNRVKARVVFTSENDDLENMESAAFLADVLESEVINLPAHGHFITQDMGTNEFPELLQSVLDA